jgi:type IV secretion system protein VirB9
MPVIPEMDQRRYRYLIKGDNPPWRPVNAYDDGRKVYIEFSPGIAQGEMPPLFVIGQDGKPELVNYRAYKNVLSSPLRPNTRHYLLTEAHRSARPPLENAQEN